MIMAKKEYIEQVFVIDELTNSIRNTISGDSFQTEISTFKKMGYLKEPKGVDFIIESKPLTNKERKEISELIKTLKKKKVVRKARAAKKKKTTENV